MSAYAHKAKRATKRARRRLAGLIAPELEAELRATRRKLKKARAAETPYDLPEELEATIARAREEHLTYLNPDNLRELAARVLDVEKQGIDGLVIEAGTARGGSAIVMAAAKAPERPMKVYDVFGLIPPPSEQDGADVHERYAKITAGDARGPGGQTYYGYRDDLYAEVEQSFGRLGVPTGERNVDLVKGLFEDTIDIDGPVAIAHLDGDWYESTMTCLTRIAPHVVPGGRIVFDDYYHWSGCRTAVDEYFKDRAGFRLEHGSRLHAVRV